MRSLKEALGFVTSVLGIKHKFPEGQSVLPGIRLLLRANNQRGRVCPVLPAPDEVGKLASRRRSTAPAYPSGERRTVRDLQPQGFAFGGHAAGDEHLLQRLIVRNLIQPGAKRPEFLGST